MKNLPVPARNLVAQLRNTHDSSRPATFIEALQQSFEGIWCFEMADGMKYVNVFKQILRGKSGINWKLLENNEILFELQDYAFTYIPKSPGACFDITLEFLNVQPYDVLIGTMSPEEINTFKMAVEAACWASDGVQEQNEWLRKGMTPIACLDWVLMWCMIVWRSEQAREYLQRGYDLEIRADWTLVACHPPSNTPRFRSIA